MGIIRDLLASKGRTEYQVTTSGSEKPHVFKDRRQAVAYMNEELARTGGNASLQEVHSSVHSNRKSKLRSIS